MTIDLKQFCSKTNHRLMEPFNDGNYTYATDGSIIVRVDLMKEITKNASDPDVHIAVSLKNLVFDHDKIFNWWFDMPDLPAKSYKICSDCKGTGKKKTCPECDGNGTLSFSSDYNGYEVDCQTCNGGTVSQEVECEGCGGKGKTKKNSFVVLNGTSFNVEYMRLLRSLPGIKLATVDKNEHAPMRFKFFGGVGLLLPIGKIRNS